jgi:hypothetical protein
LKHPPGDSYGRKLIARGPHFELMLMSWMPGDCSAIHDHGRAEWGAVRYFGATDHIVFDLRFNLLSIRESMRVGYDDICSVDADLFEDRIQRTDGGVFFCLPERDIVRAALWVVQAYLVMGTLFALAFVLLLAPRLDPAAGGSSVGFRVEIFPSVALLGPLLAARWLRGWSKPAECDAHRRCSRRGESGLDPSAGRAWTNDSLLPHRAPLDLCGAGAPGSGTLADRDRTAADGSDDGFLLLHSLGHGELLADLALSMTGSGNASEETMPHPVGKESQ